MAEDTNKLLEQIVLELRAMRGELAALHDEVRPFTEARRREGLQHVCVSTEFSERVGSSGTDAVENGVLPSGEPYRFSKAHRGAGPIRE